MDGAGAQGGAGAEGGAGGEGGAGVEGGAGGAEEEEEWKLGALPDGDAFWWRENESESDGVEISLISPGEMAGEIAGETAGEMATEEELIVPAST